MKVLKLLTRTISIVSLTFFLITACSEQKVQPLEGHWQMTSYRINYEDEPDEIKVHWQFNADGSFSQRIIYTTHETKENGNWHLSEDIASLTITYPRSNTQVEWAIIHLSDSLIRLEHTTPGFFVERSFEKQSN